MESIRSVLRSLNGYGKFSHILAIKIWTIFAKNIWNTEGKGMLTAREMRFIELQRRNKKHYLIIFFVLLIFAIIAYPVLIKVVFGFVERAFKITFSYEEEKGIFEGF
jgi:hypothetical protein